jgi:hypothetical protein
MAEDDPPCEEQPRLHSEAEEICKELFRLQPKQVLTEAQKCLKQWCCCHPIALRILHSSNIFGSSMI